MKIRSALLGVFVAAFLGGCATKPQMPVALSAEKLGAQTGRVGVALGEPKPDLYLPGADCLLCMGVATLANNSLNTYSKTLKDDEIVALKNEMVEMLRKKGVQATAIEGIVDVAGLPNLDLGENMARKDFKRFADRFDHLVVVDIRQFGFERTYASYIPTSEPKAVFRGTAYMVDLKSNAYEWYETVAIAKGADGAWDEGPNFPGLTSAYYQAVEQGKDQLKKPFVN
jgi:hypothetical protein